MFLAGKRHPRGQLNALAPGLLLRITCQQTKRRFLFDTGAAFSVLTFKGLRRLKADLPLLRASGGQNIPCFGELQSTNKFSEKCFEWTFLLADVEAPLLGADFLRSHRLLVDLHGGCLIEATSLQRLGNNMQPGQYQPQLCSVFEATLPRLRQLISQFPDVLNAAGALPPVKHAVEHVIETTGRLVSAKFWRLDPVKLQAAKAEFLKMEKEGIVQRSSSPWSSPLHMVLKKGQYLATLRRLSPPQWRYSSGQVSSPEYPRHVC
jgi:hypothetical protein